MENNSDSNVTSVSIVTDDNETVTIGIPWRVSVSVIQMKDCSIGTVRHFEKLVVLFPATQVWKRSSYKPIAGVSDELRKLWMSNQQGAAREFWDLLRLARRLECDLLEHAIVQFVQTQLKIHTNHFAKDTVLLSLPK